MDLTLTRKQFRPDGIFGEMKDADGKFSCATLEHAYFDSRSSWSPKVPVGTFICVRGMHHLFKVAKQFETFEITGVEGHTNLLIHPGNYDNDSEGCILVGTKIMQLGFGIQMLANSKVMFGLFMKAQAGLDRFFLTVANDPAFESLKSAA